LKETFGLAWMQSDYEIIEVIYKEEDYKEKFE
jgi:hypothetical protein